MDKNKYYCRINGIIHNLSDIQDIIDGKSNRDICLVMMEEHEFDAIEASTFESVIKFNNNTIPVDYNEALERLRNKNKERVNANLPHCPTCNSTNIQKISTVKRTGSILGLGILSKNIGKTFECKNCGYKW